MIDSYLEQLNDYCRKVESGEYPSGRFVKQAVRRHQIDLETAEERGLRFNADKLERDLSFFPLLKHSTSDFAGKPFSLKCFQVFICGSIFAWESWDDTPDEQGEPRGWCRRFREALVTFGKGNGKSPLAAAIANKCVFADGEERAEGYFFGTKRDQAKQVYDEACRQCRSNSTLANCTAQFKWTLNGPRDSFLKAMGSETRDDGIQPQFMAMDEIHRWGDSHRDIYSVLRASLGKRPQPLLVKISTAGDETSNILKEELEQAEKVLAQVEMQPKDGKWFGDEQFAYIASIDDDDDVYDEANWPKSNPMLLEPGGPVQIKNLRAVAAKAEAGDIQAEIDFRRLHGNQQVSSLNKPIRPEVWAKGNKPLPEDLTAYPCFGGLDLSRSRDFCGLGLVWQLPDDWFAVRGWGWTVAERHDRLRTADALRAIESEAVTIHEGNQIEKADVRRKVAELHFDYGVTSWTFDPNWATSDSDLLFEEYGIDCEPMAQTAQNYNEPIEKFLDAYLAGRIVHAGCPLLSWCASNLVIRTNSEKLKRPDKEKSANKIDPLVAIFMAWRGMLFGDEQTMPGVW